MWIHQVTFPFVAAIILFAEQGESLKCISCDSKTNATCSRVETAEFVENDCKISFFKIVETLNATLHATLGLPSDFQLPAEDEKAETCVKTVLEVNYKTLTLRGCSVFGDRTCTLMNNVASGIENFTVISCSFCKSENCNVDDITTTKTIPRTTPITTIDETTTMNATTTMNDTTTMNATTIVDIKPATGSSSASLVTSFLVAAAALFISSKF